jgi:DNA-binding NarL/FixJ family response regulator
MQRLSILIIEQSFIIREGIKTLLSQMNQPFSMEEVDEFVIDLPKLLRKTKPNLVLINPKYIGTDIVLPRTNNSKIIFAAILQGEIEPNIKSKFECCLQIDADKQTLSKQFEEMIEKGAGKKKIQQNSTLSEREISILKLVALGLTNNDIGEKLYISTHTVMTHRKNITRKLGIKTVSGLTVFAILNNIIKAEEYR